VIFDKIETLHVPLIVNGYLKLVEIESKILEKLVRTVLRMQDLVLNVEMGFLIQEKTVIIE
jgi:hypothetical protein